MYTVPVLVPQAKVVEDGVLYMGMGVPGREEYGDVCCLEQLGSSWCISRGSDWLGPAEWRSACREHTLS